MREYQIQVEIKNAIVSFSLRADSLEDAISVGREKLKKVNVFSDDVEVIDLNEEITGVY